MPDDIEQEEILLEELEEEVILEPTKTPEEVAEEEYTNYITETDKLLTESFEEGVKYDSI